MNVRSPYEILEENSKNYNMHKRFREIDKKCKKLLQKAEDIGRDSGNILFFHYSGDMSISSELANSLKQKFPSKIIVVGYMNGAKVNVSARGDNVKNKVLKAIEGMEGATGGGHDMAVGAKIKLDDWEKFKERFLEIS